MLRRLQLDHCAPTEARSVEKSFRAINLSLLRSKDEILDPVEQANTAIYSSPFTN